MALSLIKNHRWFCINTIIVILFMGLFQWYLDSYWLQIERENYPGLVMLIPVILLFCSLLIGWMLNFILNTYVYEDVYKYSEEKIIKKISFKKIFIFFIVIQSFWVMYWIRNPIVLLFILYFVVIFECSYKVTYPETKYKDRRDLIINYLIFHKIDFKKEKKIGYVINEIEKTGNIFTKIKLIIFDFSSACGLGRVKVTNSLLIFFYVFIFGFAMTSTELMYYDYPLINIKTLKNNYKEDLPSLNQSIFYANVHYQFKLKTGGARRQQIILKISIFDEGKELLYIAKIRSIDSLKIKQYREKKKQSLWDIYDNREGKANIWIDNRTQELMQLVDQENNYTISYEMIMENWLDRRNSSRWRYFVGTLLIGTFFLFDILFYFYLRKFYL